MVLPAPGLEGVVGFVVAGGHSRRMGTDKALLAWGPATLLDDALARLGQVVADVRILAGSQPAYSDRGRPVHEDALPGGGSLGGIYTGLLELERAPGLFLAVDLPFVPVLLLARLLELAPGYDAVVPVSPGGPEPLCAVYAPACREPIRRRLQDGQLKMTAFWPEVRVREVGPSELQAYGDPGLMFRNLNTPEDYEEAARRLRAP
ncbi:MAG TPA: molybdenum cofactor guanylyltransferase [Vicinamibacteria bacterium]|nr:molybdenum cofactor guanylyltransferase [Vicinamibacteria bacterium]